MNILGIIPARGGSKRLPRKNIKLLAGKPLIAHSIEAGLKSKYINKVVLSTEDKEIAETAMSFGADVVNRPIELAQDETKTAPVLVHVVQELEKQGYTPDIIVLLQPTCPLRDDVFIDEALDQFFASPENDSIFSAGKKSSTMALWKKCHSGEVDSLYDYHLRPRWQDVHLNESIYGEDGAFYAIKADAFKRWNDFIGENPCIYETAYKVDIDNDADFEKAERLLAEKNS